ncbi:hypothetical protein EW146_g9012 [Bondarzewia mesenterica]|uniref:Uncharacterized protein n=1 Tax=Bondarzewia mesenterica TaxID=1095465 RepID=A0A4S4L9Z3_9AGAM|nr:hypothetical protein EW146_g9012 [Bondarzewia mesenterica]
MPSRSVLSNGQDVDVDVDESISVLEGFPNSRVSSTAYMRVSSGRHSADTPFQPLKRRRTLGLNSRYDRMIDQVNMVSNLRTSTPPRRRRMYSSGSSTLSDAPKTPLDAYNSLQEGRLGVNFAVMKMNDHATMMKSSSPEYHTEYSPTNHPFKPPPPIPDWLNSTLSNLEQSHPLRRLMLSTNKPKPACVPTEQAADPCTPSVYEKDEDSVFAFELPTGPDSQELNDPHWTNAGENAHAPQVNSDTLSASETHAYLAPPAPIFPVLATDLHLPPALTAYTDLDPIPFSKPGPGSHVSLSAPLNAASPAPTFLSNALPSEILSGSVTPESPNLAHGPTCTDNAGYEPNSSHTVIPLTFSEHSLVRSPPLMLRNSIAFSTPAPNPFSVPGPNYHTTASSSPPSPPKSPNDIFPNMMEVDPTSLDFRWSPFVRGAALEVQANDIDDRFPAPDRLGHGAYIQEGAERHSISPFEEPEMPSDFHTSTAGAREHRFDFPPLDFEHAEIDLTARDRYTDSDDLVPPDTQSYCDPTEDQPSTPPMQDHIWDMPRILRRPRPPPSATAPNSVDPSEEPSPVRAFAPAPGIFVSPLRGADSDIRGDDGEDAMVAEGQSRTWPNWAQVSGRSMSCYEGAYTRRSDSDLQISDMDDM